MSSRSLAAARARRAGDAAPPVSGNRPGTSVGSAAAFSNMPPQPGNVRVASRQPMPQQPPQQRPQSAAFQQIQQQQQQVQNGLPFTKLSISDAIGLITLRLGRVEQWVIETEHDNEGKDNSSTTTSGNAVDNSVLVSLLNRLETVEKRNDTNSGSGTASFSSDEVTKLTSELASLNERYTKFCDEANKQTITIAKHTEQLFRFERELIETKDILKTFMIKYDNFVQESNEKLADYECAISEIEKSIAPTTTTFIDDISSILPQEQNSPEVINPDDLKSLVKQELSGI
jgi:hypothetical protein